MTHFPPFQKKTKGGKHRQTLPYFRLETPCQKNPYQPLFCLAALKAYSLDFFLVNIKKALFVFCSPPPQKKGFLFCPFILFLTIIKRKRKPNPVVIIIIIK